MVRIESRRKTMKDAQGGSVFDELQSFCYHADVGGRKIELERSDRDTPAIFGTMPRRAGVSVDDYGSVEYLES